jgi:hypothetical protein
MMNTTLLTQAIERIMANRYGKTVTVRLANAKGKNKEKEAAGRTAADEAHQG